MVCSSMYATIIGLDKMEKLKYFIIKSPCAPRIIDHVIPGTDFKLYLDFDDSQFVHLCNTQTGKKQILIQGSPSGHQFIPCSFFLKCGNDYELHFCIVKQEKGTTVNSWYRWYLGKDFFKMLKKYGGLPLEMNIDSLMATMKERDDLTKERDVVTK